jgi:hypothetical protein
MKFVNSGLMPLNVDKLTSDTIALAHNGKQNGDVMADPDMEVRIYPDLKMAEALTFRNDYMGPITGSVSRAWEILYETQDADSPQISSENNIFPAIDFGEILKDLH